MTRRGFALLADGGAWVGEVAVEDGRVLLAPADLPEAVGFELKPEGLCRGPLCVPTASRRDLRVADSVDLAVLAEILDRPLALDLESGAAALGESAADQRQRLETLEAPDFELPDLEGRLQRLSSHRGKKVLLHAFASW
jgi:hypothetical protein